MAWLKKTTKIKLEAYVLWLISEQISQQLQKELLKNKRN